MTFCTAVTILATIMNVGIRIRLVIMATVEKNNTTGGPSGAGTAYHSVAPAFTLWFFLWGGWVRGVRGVAQSSVFFVVFGRLLFVFLPFFIFSYVVCLSTNFLGNVNSTVGNIQMKFHKLWWSCIWETGWSKSGPKKE